MSLHFKESIPADRNQIPRLRRLFNSEVAPHLKGENTAADCELCLDEVLTNIIMHGLEDNISEKIDIRITVQGQTIKMTFKDHGRSFTPEEVPGPDIKMNMRGERRGGFGLFLIKKLMDKFDYKHKKGRNILQIVKHF